MLAHPSDGDLQPHLRASARPAAARRPRAREARARVRLRAERRAAPRRSRRRGTSASTSSCSPTASANALCACSPPNGTSSSGLARPGEHVAVGDGAHRHVRDDRPAVGGRDRDRERVRARERLARPAGDASRRGDVAVSTRDEAAVRELPHPVAERPGREACACRRRRARGRAGRRAAQRPTAASVR